MTLPDQFISATLIVCDKIIIDKSDLPTIIQIVDILQFQRPMAGQPFVILINVFFSVRFVPGVPTPSDHVFELRLKRPNGETKTIGDLLPATLQTSQFPDLPHGFNIPISFPLVASHAGTHYLTAVLDGHEIAKVAFSLVELMEQK